MASPALRFSSASMEPLQLVRPPDVMKLTRWNRTRLRLVSPRVRRGPTPSPDTPGLILRLAGHPPLLHVDTLCSMVVLSKAHRKASRKGEAIKHLMRVIVLLLCLTLVFGLVACGIADIVKDDVAPSTPTITKTTPDNDNTPTFSWNAATDDGTGVDHYEVNMDGGWIWMKAGDVTTYTWYAELSDGSHTFEVKAVDNARNAGTAASLTFTIDTTFPIISSVTVPSITETGCTIAWTTNEDTTCQVEYGTTAAYGTSQPTSVNFLCSYAYCHMINVTGLTADTTYHYRVRAIDSSGKETISRDYSFVTLPS